MEYVSDCETLRAFCNPPTSLPVDDVVQIICKSAKALDHAHRHGVIHRDVKPANILLTKDRDVKLTDFGISMLARSDESATTQLGGFAGSPLYMAPEQITQSLVTTQVDLFALGLVMYEMLAGVHPFEAENVPAITYQIVNKPHVPITKVRVDTPDVLEPIVNKLLEKKPENRYKTGLEVVSDLSDVFTDLTLTEQELSVREKFNLVRDLDFFSDFSEPEVSEVINSSLWVEFEPGETIILEGELDSSFFILISGEATVRKGNLDVYTISRGECFGEIGFITREKRTASVIASTSVWVMKLRPSMIDGASANCQLRVQREVLSTLAKRLTMATERII